MTKYVEFPLESGGTILIESPDMPTKAQTGFRQAGLGEPVPETAEKARQSFDASVENVRKSADLLVSKLRALSDPPDEMEVTFSLKVSGELSDIVIGKTGADANYSVVLKWRKEKGKEEKEEREKKENGELKEHKEKEEEESRKEGQ